MRKMSYLGLFIAFMFLNVGGVFASKVVNITGYDVRFRSAPTVDSNILRSFNPGVKLNLLDQAAGTSNGCGGAWYKASMDGQVGYVCSDYAVIEEVKDEEVPSDDKEYKEYLKKQGFPDTYLDYLVTLHKKHPNWQFKVFKADISFSKMVGYEYRANGHSLIEDYGRYYDGYKSVDSWSYNYLTDVFTTNFIGGGSYWYAASRDTISYYMDPRNFLNEQQIFMFETLSYNSTYHTDLGIEKMLENTFMKGIADKNDNKTYIDAFRDAAIKYNISPYVLISRVIQEVGANGSTIVSGNVSGYEGYYNFYNIKAAGSTKEETINNGLNYAKEQGWDTPYKAIVGGGYFLSDNYISQGQDTLYLQKWDLFGPMYGNHQYMQNIQAPSTESVKTYNGYKNVAMLEGNFTFSIPVFDDMPSKTSLPNKGNPNNYLSSLAVNGNYLFEKATNTKEFNLNLDSTTTSIAVDATKVSSKATISGVGSISLKGEKQTVSLVVTAENGATRTYKINITRDLGEAIDISEILRVTNIKNDGSYIFGIEVGTDISSIINKITTKEEKAVVSCFDKTGKEKKSGIVSSFDKINIKTDREEKNYTFIIYGDVNGDGLINSADYITIKNDIMDVKKLSDIERIAADANKDGKVNSADYITIKNDIMDVKKIEQ